MGKTEIAFASIIGILLMVLLYAAVANGREWESFKSEHKCKVVAHIAGDVFNTITPTSNGVSVGIGSTPDKTGWLCDDGITYYR